MRKLTFYLFIGVALAELSSVAFNLSVINWIAKPLIMISLTVYYLTNSPKRSSLFLLAMAFCWLGDVLLMFQANQLYFMAGLVSFLTGHVLYIVCYRQMRNEASKNELLGPQKIRFSLPIILAGTGLVVILFPSLGDLTLPVMIYALVITTMTLQALFRFGFTSKRSFILIFIGALLFMVSDSLLAINKFLQPLPFASFSIMLTYIVAQYLIVEGAMSHFLKESK